MMTNKNMTLYVLLALMLALFLSAGGCKNDTQESDATVQTQEPNSP